MPKTRRRRADRFWRDTIVGWKGSGQTVAAFCAARGIGESTFFARRRELARRERSPSVPAPIATFAAVRVIPDPTVELVIPGGVIVRVPVATDPAADEQPGRAGRPAWRAVAEAERRAAGCSGRDIPGEQLVGGGDVPATRAGRLGVPDGPRRSGEPRPSPPRPATGPGSSRRTGIRAVKNYLDPDPDLL